MRTHMPTSGDATPERRSRLESMRLITEMSFPFHAFGFQSFAVISTWSASSQSRQSSTSTSMSIRVTITQQWSLAHAMMKSSFIWIHTTSLPVKAYGDCSSLACMRSFLTSLDFMSIFQTSRQSLGMQQTLKLFNKWLNTKEPRTQPLLPISKPMPGILKHANYCTKTFHPNLSGIKQLSSGLQDRGVSLSDICTMLIYTSVYHLYHTSQANACTAICILPGEIMRRISFFARAISFLFWGGALSFLHHYLYHFCIIIF